MRESMRWMCVVPEPEPDSLEATTSTALALLEQQVAIIITIDKSHPYKAAETVDVRSDRSMCTRPTRVYAAIPCEIFIELSIASPGYKKAEKLGRTAWYALTMFMFVRTAKCFSPSDPLLEECRIAASCAGDLSDFRLITRRPTRRRMLYSARSCTRLTSISVLW